MEFIGDENPSDDITGSLDDLFQILSNPDRRRLLYLLEESETTLEYEEAAQQLSKHGSVNESQAQISMIHQHLPKLRDAGLVEYDDRSETIRYNGDPDLDELLGYAREREYTEE